MNEHFVNIKVDREERPDVDDVYMTACHLSSGKSCGWPLNSIALPDGKPVWAGTYFPKKQWLDVLDYFIKTKENEADKLTTYADQLQQGIVQSEQIEPIVSNSVLTITPEQLNQVASDFINQVDWKHGGIKGAPKFPIPNNYLMLMLLHDLIGNDQIKDAVVLTLNKMAAGGLYDQIGGGFARYSVDEVWKVPHFEKMLYDNAQLVSVYSQAYQLTKDESYKKIVQETIAFIQRELYENKESAFYSSLDAASEGEEGKFYVWTEEEIKEIVADPKHFEIVKDYYNIKAKGNWEDEKNILYIHQSVDQLGDKFGMNSDGIQQILNVSNGKLLLARDHRVRPGLDDKILTSWNGLMIKGLVDAYQAIGDDTYLELAKRNIEFIEENLILPDGRLWRTYKEGKAHINGFLDDYAHIIQAYIKLYEVTFKTEYLDQAQRLADYSIKHFYEEPSGMFYYTSDEDPPLIVRKKEMTDNVIPASNSTMAKNLHALHLYFGNAQYQEISDKMIQTMSDPILSSKQPNFYSNWVMALASYSRPPYEIAIVGDDFEPLRKELSSYFLPNAKFLGGAEEGKLALLKDKKVDGETMIYVCQNKICKFPVKEVADALKLMQD
jgi:uncharacterized protein YyaL (SSP411 family)